MKKQIMTTMGVLLLVVGSYAAQSHPASSSVKVMPTKTLNAAESQAIGDAAWRILKHGHRAEELLNRQGEKGKTAALKQLEKADQLLGMIEKAIPPVKAVSEIKLGGETYKDADEYKPEMVPVALSFGELEIFDETKQKSQLAQADAFAKGVFLDRFYAQSEIKMAEKAIGANDLKTAKGHLRALDQSIVFTLEEVPLKVKMHKTAKR